MSAQTPVRIAILGAGIIAQSIHIPSIHRAGLTLVAVGDLSPSRADEVAARYGIRGVTNPADIFTDPQIDAVLIATPGSHAELTIAALEAGKHVLAEKPLALNHDEVDRIERAQRDSGRVLQIGYMKMYDPLTERAASAIAQLTGIRLVRVTVSHPADAPQIQHLRITPPANDADRAEIERALHYALEQTDRAIPGVTSEFGAYFRNIIHGSVIHETSLLRGLGFHLPSEWTADVFPKLRDNEPSSLLAVGRANDVRFIISWNWLPEYPEYNEEVMVLGSNGRVVYHLAKPYVLEERSRLVVQRHDGQERQDTTYTEINETGFLRQLLAFADSIRNGSPVRANLDGVRADIDVLTAIATAAMNSPA
ncbi:MAG: Gfo/Idh/MocA family oxidoreductase [Microbacteriaceae bacterium]|nr:Gfo/Idh/MocA family oxidoreductase [Microbacteriaceae bacterium]